MNFWVVSVLMVVAGLLGWVYRGRQVRSENPAPERAAAETEDSPPRPAADGEPIAVSIDELERLKGELARVHQELREARERQVEREPPSVSESRGEASSEPTALSKPSPSGELTDAAEPADSSESAQSSAPTDAAAPADSSNPTRRGRSVDAAGPTDSSKPTQRGKPRDAAQQTDSAEAAGEKRETQTPVSRVPPPPRRGARSISEDERRLAAAQDQARFTAIQLAASRTEVQQLQARLKRANEVIRRKTELLRQAELRLGASRSPSVRPSAPPRSSPQASLVALTPSAPDSAQPSRAAEPQSEAAEPRAQELERSLKQAQLESERRAERIEALLEEVRELRQRLGSLLPEPATAPVLLDAPTQGAPDDLKRLRGVGPKVQRLLNQLGVYYFWQIAAWKPEHVRYVERHLLQLRGRIERDEWCQQAAALADAEGEGGATTSATVPVATTGGGTARAARASTTAKSR